MQNIVCSVKILRFAMQNSNSCKRTTVENVKMVWFVCGMHSCLCCKVLLYLKDTQTVWRIQIQWRCFTIEEEESLTLKKILYYDRSIHTRPQKVLMRDSSHSSVLYFYNTNTVTSWHSSKENQKTMTSCWNALFPFFFIRRHSAEDIGWSYKPSFLLNSMDWVQSPSH